MLLDILRNPVTSIPYAALAALKQHSRAGFLLETADSDFNWQKYAGAGLCECVPKRDHPEQALYSWWPAGDRARRATMNGYFDVRWNGRALELLQIQYESACGYNTRVWIGAEDEAAAQAFFAAVCRWNAPVRDEVFVYQEGSWTKDADLYRSIQSSRLDGLILPPGLKDAIRADVAAFFEARDRYRQFNVPWKRGLILIGPPGNGKTHMIQALINDLKKPCLYVKSLKSRYQNEDLSIREVFEQARESAPCVLVLEDIDALIDGENRSFFLNELDGFRKNDGLLTIATTNHPERLDPAIVDRPSRFDRKYHFDLPAEPERAAYLRWWNRQFDGALRLTDGGLDAVAGATAGFSFAYLKELALAATMAWVNRPEVPMDELMAAHVVLLREQMASARPQPGTPAAP
ncbi:ATP-binding protein [Gemmata sp. JC717]|uniref:ATP-binding protein n=1 Tax=Gemmata algarum TaxID=2975278 RepID=A0ABU5EZU8_9BACT|nr:ATP-binding protein [Gemmata algarum]MDY3554004.1 ATP-binding protein [Gemmata algarum]MDY3560826.1 ATP-binding protein [Gemmata algarum]